MEFGDWIVSGLEQLRTGNLPGGQALYQTVSGGLGGHPALDAFMNTGDPAARAQLAQLISQASAANPAFEQQLRAAASAAQGGGVGAVAGVGGGPGTTPFLKSSKGIMVLVAAAVLVVGGGVALAVGLSGSGSGGTTSFAKSLEGTWTCTNPRGGSGTLTIGDGTWSAGGDSGTWTQSGGKATVTSKSHPGKDITATNVPSSGGSFDLVATGAAADSAQAPPAHIKGLVSAHELNVQFSMSASDLLPTFTCTK